MDTPHPQTSQQNNTQNRKQHDTNVTQQTDSNHNKLPILNQHTLLQFYPTPMIHGSKNNTKICHNYLVNQTTTARHKPHPYPIISDLTTDKPQQLEI
jgi:hypothetical protein